MGDIGIIEAQDAPQVTEQPAPNQLFDQAIERPPTHPLSLRIYNEVRRGDTSGLNSLTHNDVRNFVLGELYNSGNQNVRDIIARNYPNFRPTGVGESTSPDRMAQFLGLATQFLEQPGNACEVGRGALESGNDLIARILALRNSIRGITSNPERPRPFAADNPPGAWDIWGLAPTHTVHDPTDGAMRPLPSYWSVLRSVFSNAHTELSRNHNDVLQFNLGEIMARRGLDPNAPVTVINVDAHSDILARAGSRYSIADWGNAMIRTNPNVTDYYWILPDEFRSDPQYRNFFAPSESHNGNFSSAPNDFVAYVHNTTGEIRWNQRPPSSEMSNYRAVNIHIRTMSTMDNLRGRNVVLTTDLDIFANRGYDTELEATTRWRGEEGFQNYVNMLRDRGINPFFHFLSFSPEYLERRREVWNGILQFAALSAQASPEGVTSQFTYHYNRVYPLNRSEHDGIALNAMGNRGMQLILALFQTDALSQNPNGIINLATDNAERRHAIAAARRIFNVASDEEALSILNRFAPPNRQLNFRSIWQSMRDMCRTRFR